MPLTRRSPGSAPLAALLVILTLAPLGAQTAPAGVPGESVRVVPGSRYRAGGLHRFLFGRHYRDLWTSPVDAEVLDLARFAGGLTVLERGGGQQTRSLRLRAADGREFAFRSVDKDPSVILPEELRGTVASSVLQDQISSSHPAGALVVPSLLAAAGVPHSTPRYVVLPDDPALGEFRAEFGGLLGLLEERPDAEGGGTVVPGAVRVISSDRLFERVEASADDRVDAGALLAARLMDVFLGDWDRHRDQWRWATFDTGAPRRWLPIPRDRDQAFARFDGLLLAIARGQAPQLVNFGPRYSTIVGATWNGRELDRRFLLELERPVWDSTAAALQAALTDEVIESAVAELPESFRAADSLRLTVALRARRGRLPAAARAFYALLQEEMDLHATDQADRAEITAEAGGTIGVRLYAADEATPWFERRLDRRDTGEFRLYLHGGADRVVVRGEDTRGIVVRIIGGGGDDVLLDSTAAQSARLYDTDPGTAIAAGDRLDTRRYVLPPKPSPTALPPRDWGSRTLPVLWTGAAPDVGVLIGGGLLWTDYGFRQQPWASRHLLRAAYATGASQAKGEYRGDFRGENHETHLTIMARASGIETLRFNGLGNEVTLNGSKSFYRVRQVQLVFEPSLEAPLSRVTSLSVGPTVRYSDTKQGNRFIDQARPYGSDHFGMVGVRADVRLDSRDRAGYPTRGAVLQAGGAIIPGIWDARSSFGELHGVASTYLSAAALPMQPVLALRAGGKRVFGDYPYMEAAYLGDASTVRLGWENRYSGDAAVWGSAELRLSAGGSRIVLPGEWGVFGLGDIGRVFLEGESSSTWHGAYGAGIWIGFLGKGNAFSIAYAQSAERGRVYAQAGFAY